MSFISVLIAAAAAYAFGAVWYMSLAKPWMAAAGVTEDMMNDKSATKAAYITSAVCAVIVAGMMRHTFAAAGIDGAGKGLMSGLGIGLFMVTPWIATNYGFSSRPRALTLIDGGYATGGCAVMGLVLGLF
jgi:hypothetical protein